MVLMRVDTDSYPRRQAVPRRAYRVRNTLSFHAASLSPYLSLAMRRGRIDSWFPSIGIREISQATFGFS
jgi:hypothetical protein